MVILEACLLQFGLLQDRLRLGGGVENGNNRIRPWGAAHASFLFPILILSGRGTDLLFLMAHHRGFSLRWAWHSRPTGARMHQPAPIHQPPCRCLPPRVIWHFKLLSSLRSRTCHRTDAMPSVGSFLWGVTLPGIIGRAPENPDPAAVIGTCRLSRRATTKSYSFALSIAMAGRHCLESAVELSPQSDDPSSCPRFPSPRCVH